MKLPIDRKRLYLVDVSRWDFAAIGLRELELRESKASDTLREVMAVRQGLVAQALELKKELRESGDLMLFQLRYLKDRFTECQAQVVAIEKLYQQASRTWLAIKSELSRRGPEWDQPGF